MANGPKLILQFEAADNVKFALNWEGGSPTEGQFQIAGEELMSIGRILRDNRIRVQLQLTMPALAPAAAAVPASAPIGPGGSR